MTDVWMPSPSAAARSSGGWSPLDIFTSPFYGLLNTASNLPGVRNTGLNEWVNTTPIFQGAQNLREEAPGLALGADIVASFVPFIGWGSAINRASQAANLGSGLLGLTNRAGVAAAGLSRGTPLGFALGEAVRYTPPALAMTGFDVAGGEYENPIDAATGLVLGTALGVGGQAIGHALTPFISRLSRPIGEGWSIIFEPGPQLGAMYGFSGNTRRAIEAARHERVREAVRPGEEPQIVLRDLWEISDGIAAGDVEGVDPEIIAGHIDSLHRRVVEDAPPAHVTTFDFPVDARADGERIRNQTEFVSGRFGPKRTNNTLDYNQIRVPLTGTGEHIENPEFLAGQLQLPARWLQDVKWPGIIQVDVKRSNTFRRMANLPERTGVPGEVDSNAPQGEQWRRVTRTLPDGRTQTWTARREANQGLWTLMTEVPGKHTMSARRFYGAKAGKSREDARAFFSFKTDRPAQFFGDNPLTNPFTDLDNAGPDHLWYRRARLDTTKSSLLKEIMDLEDVYLNANSLRSMNEAMATRRGREKVAAEILAGPAGGKSILSNVRRYAAPTIHQFIDSPLAQSAWGLYRAISEGLEGAVRQQLHGRASIEPGQSPIGATLLGGQGINDENALIPLFRRLHAEDPTILNTVQWVLKRAPRDYDLSALDGTAAGQWLTRLRELADDGNLRAYNEVIGELQKIGATDARQIPFRKAHYGISRSWDGSIFIPIYRAGQIQPEAAIAGGSLAQARTKAEAWLRAVEAEEPGVVRRMGDAYIPGQSEHPPGWLQELAGDPRFLQPRSNMRGYEHEFEPYRHVDDFIAEVEDNFLRRARYVSRVAADALTASKRAQLRAESPDTWQVLNTRIAQLFGQPTASEEWQNRIVDSFFAKHFGTNSASKLADGINEFMFHSLYFGHVGTPLLNMMSVLQTHLPAAAEILTSNPGALRGYGYWLPQFGSKGVPTRGFSFVSDPIGVLWGGIKRAMNPSDNDREVFEYLFNNKIIGGFMNEFTGQDRTLVARASEGIRGPEDALYWFRRVSGLMMAKTTQLSRTFAAGMSMEALDRLERAWGFQFTPQQRIHNAMTMIERADYAYFKQDRPLMFTTPMGSVFGNQKTWMTNYMWMLSHYFGLAGQGNWAPLLLTMGSTVALGGAFAVPILGQGLDLLSKWTTDKTGHEFIYENMGEGGNAIAFGLPALLGLSMSENVAAPGANLAHDAEFFFSVVALRKAEQLGRVAGRGYEDAVTLGMNPFRDPLFMRQFSQAFAPRAMYRAWDAVTADTLRSARTGYPMVREFGLGARVLHGLGFQSTDIALQYEAYGQMIQQRNTLRDRVSAFGEAYAQAMVVNDGQEMHRLLQRATMLGVPLSSVMQSAQTRLRNNGLDMFGRNFTDADRDRNRAMLEAAGVNVGAY